jgi:hypothetical protein
VPFTRATTASDADEVEAADEEEDDEFLEQPTAAGTISASAAIVATVPARGRDAHNFSSGIPNNLSEVNFSNEVSNVMAAVLGKCAGPPDWRGGQSRNRFRFAMALISHDSDDRVSRNRQLTTM